MPLNTTHIIIINNIQMILHIIYNILKGNTEISCISADDIEIVPQYNDNIVNTHCNKQYSMIQ